MAQRHSFSITFMMISPNDKGRGRLPTWKGPFHIFCHIPDGRPSLRMTDAGECVHRRGITCAADVRNGSDHDIDTGAES